MSAPPKTRLYVTPEEAGAIRAAVIAADPSGLGGDCTEASDSDVQALTHLLADPSLSNAIYFAWMFEAFKVRLICVTAALDNVRSARVIEAAGFLPMGERQSRRADGSERRSRYWEMSIEQWRKLGLSTSG